MHNFILLNFNFRFETSKKGWTTEAHLLEGKRTTEEELTEIILDSKNTFLKFTENDQIIGSVLLVEKEHQLYVGMLTVSPELQNSGIRKKMLAEAENHAKSLGLFVRAIPPSAVVIILTGWKLNIVISLYRQFPIGSPKYLPPIACDASSITLNP